MTRYRSRRLAPLKTRRIVLKLDGDSWTSECIVIYKQAVRASITSRMYRDSWHRRKGDDVSLGNTCYQFLSFFFQIFCSLFGERSSPFWPYRELRASPRNRGQRTEKSIVRSRSMVFKVLSCLDGPLLRMHTLGSKLPLICLTLESLQHGLQIVYYCYCKSLEQQRAISLVYTRRRNFLKTRRELR